MEKLLEVLVEKLLTGRLWKDGWFSTGFITGFQQECRAVFGRQGRGFWKFYTVSTGPTTTSTTPLILILLLERDVYNCFQLGNTDGVWIVQRGGARYKGA